MKVVKLLCLIQERYIDRIYGSIIHKKRMYMVGFECASNEGVDKNVRFAIAVGSRFSYIGTA